MTDKTSKKSTGKGFKKGHAKIGGRKKGTSNKVTTNLRKLLEQQLIPHIEHIGDTIAAIEDPKEKASVVSQWANYLLPKYSNTTINSDSSRDLSTEEYINSLNDSYKKSDIKVNIKSLKIINND